MPIRYHLSLIFLLIAITLLVYYDSFNNSFVYDDYPFVVENTAIRRLDAASIIRNFTVFRATASNKCLAKDVWRPLVTTSFAIDYKLWKLNPRFYHVENVIFHAANAALVYITVFLVLNNAFAAFIASIVFAIHPAQTEAVTWASGRSNVLFLFFFLWAFLFHMRNRRFKESALNYSLSLIFFTLALLSKEMAIVLPLLLVLYDLHFYPGRGRKHNLKYYLPFFLTGAFYILARFSVLGVLAQRQDWWGGGIFYNILATFKAVAGYIRILFFPINPKILYLMDIPQTLLDRGFLASLLIMASALVFYLIFRRKIAVSFYVLWFFVTLIPVYNIVPFKAVMAERFLYLPLIAFAALFGMLFSKRTLLVFITMAAILITYGALTISRNVEWRSELSFYMQEAMRSPLDPTAHYNLGYAYQKEAKIYAGDRTIASSYYALAIKEYKEAIRLKPVSQPAYVGLGNVYNDIGNYDEAIKNFRKALAVKEDSDAYNNLAVSCSYSGMYAEAVKSCKRALYLNPGHVSACINLGNAYFMKGEYEKAKTAWMRASGLGAKDLTPEDRMKAFRRMKEKDAQSRKS